MFRKRRRAEVQAQVGDAQARAEKAFGDMNVEELQAYLTRERAEFDEAVLEKKKEFAAVRERIDRLVARERFGELLESLPEHSVQELAGLLIKED